MFAVERHFRRDGQRGRKNRRLNWGIAKPFDAAVEAATLAIVAKNVWWFSARVGRASNHQVQMS